MNGDNDFSYKYNAKEAAEVKRIREKYAAPEEDKLALLYRLDRSVGKTAKLWSLIIGIVGTLIMGGGMSLCMTGASDYFIVGVAVGVVGIVLVVIAYPIYSAILTHERKKIAPTILALTDELMK